MKGRLLIVDDNKPVLESFRIITRDHFERVHSLGNPDRIPLICRDEDIDVVLLDMNFKGGHQSGQEGLYWLGRIQEVNPDISVVFITAYGELDLAVEALKRGATDFITKPWSNDKLLATLSSAAQLALSKKELKKTKKQGKLLRKAIAQPARPIIGESPAIRQVNQMISKVAVTDANVLILGENGTGKELVAQQIHAQSLRRDELMISIDLGAIPGELFESELFGHEKGAFTDAREIRIGKFEAASGGTLFLDEVANLPIHLQSKLLMALQNREIVRLGSNELIPVDIRLVSATNQNPENLVLEGLFREDLLYRLNTIVIHVPPLRERGTDILLLARHFLGVFADKYRKPAAELDASAEAALLAYDWPGNVRELQHAMERAIILNDNQLLSQSSFDLRGVSGQNRIQDDITLDEMEKRMIEAAVQKNGGNMTEAARQLGVTRQTLYNKLKKFGD